MKSHQKIFKLLPITLLATALIHQRSSAAPVWHCSRSSFQIVDASDQFNLASLTLNSEVIRLSLQDLYGVYQGRSVRLNGGLPLSACVLSTDADATASALQSIGASNSAIQKKSQQTAFTNIHRVADEQAMLACISKNHPAIGYLSKATQTEAVGPCF